MSSTIDEKQILVYAIGVRYWELQGTAKTSSVELLTKLLTDITPKEKLVDHGAEQDNLKNLGQILQHLLTSKSPQNHKMTLQTFRLSVKDDDDLYTALKEMIDEKQTEEEIDNLVQNYLHQIHIWFQRHEFMKLVKKELTTMIYSNQPFNLSETAKELVEKVTPYTAALDSPNEKTGIKSPIVSGGFSTDDLDSIVESWSDAQAKASPEGILKTGFQGLNRALGTPRGFFRGDTVVIGALQHKYKSGTITDLVVDIPHFNQPYFYTDKKKAAIVHISFENHVDDDLTRVYRRIYAHKYGTNPSLEEMLNLDPQRVADEINDYMGCNGFKYIYVRINPSDVGYIDIQKFVRDIEDDGYEIHALFMDYLAMMSTKGIFNSRDGTEYQTMFRLMRNFCSERYITLITPHQLSTEATYLNRDGAEADFTSRCAGNSYYAKSKQIDREVDVEIIQHLVNKKTLDGMKTYLVATVGKNRKVHDTKQEHKSWAYEFTDTGLMADFDKEKHGYVEVSTIKRAGGAGSMEDDW